MLQNEDNMTYFHLLQEKNQVSQRVNVENIANQIPEKLICFEIERKKI
jgi:hypothetical protein